MTDPAASAGRNLEPLSAATLHVVIDMQRLFAEPTAWHTPALAGIVAAVARLSAARASATLFARFIPADSATAAPGRWGRFYERWGSVTAEHLDPALLDLVAPLQALARDAAVFTKAGYSIFGAPAFLERLRARPVDTLVLTGVETDSCVLASLFDAVDRGYRVVVPRDAVASGSEAAHDAVLAQLLPRMAEQVDVTTVDELLRQWPEIIQPNG